MIYAGTDIAKLNHFASVVSSDSAVLVEPFEFSNDFEGFCSLSLVLDRFEQDNLLIGLESTAHYGNNLIKFLFSKGYRFCILNPRETSALRNNHVLRTKTGRADTFIKGSYVVSLKSRILTCCNLRISVVSGNSS